MNNEQKICQAFKETISRILNKSVQVNNMDISQEYFDVLLKNEIIIQHENDYMYCNRAKYNNTLVYGDLTSGKDNLYGSEALINLSFKTNILTHEEFDIKSIIK